MARNRLNTSIVPYGTVQDAAIPRQPQTRKAADGDFNLLEAIGLGGFFKGGKAGTAPSKLARVATGFKYGVPLAGLAVLQSAMNAGQEYDGEGAGVDTAQAAGRFVGDLGTTASMAALGGLVAGPPGAIAAPIIAQLLGVNKGVGQLGSGLGQAVYDGITGNSADKRYRKQTELVGERLMHLSQINDTIAKMADARAINMARQNAEIMTDYNFANNLNTAGLMLQQNEANALNIALQNTL